MNPAYSQAFQAVVAEGLLAGVVHVDEVPRSHDCGRMGTLVYTCGPAFLTVCEDCPPESTRGVTNFMAWVRRYLETSA